MAAPTERTGLVIEETGFSSTDAAASRFTLVNAGLALLTVAVIATSIALPIAIVNSQPRQSPQVVGIPRAALAVRPFPAPTPSRRCRLTDGHLSLTWLAVRRRRWWIRC